MGGIEERVWEYVARGAGPDRRPITAWMDHSTRFSLSQPNYERTFDLVYGTFIKSNYRHVKMKKMKKMRTRRRRRRRRRRTNKRNIQITKRND